MYLWCQPEYAEFLDFAHHELAEQAEDGLFHCVVRQLWIEDAGEPRPGWRHSLRFRYLARREWLRQGIAATAQRYAVNDEDLAETLRVWQPRLPLQLDPKDAALMIRSVLPLSQ